MNHRIALLLLFPLTLSLCTGCAVFPRHGAPARSVVIVGNGRTADEAHVPGSAGWATALLGFFDRDVAAQTGAQAGQTLESFIVSGGLAAALAEKPGFLVAGFGQDDAEAGVPLPRFRSHLRHLVAVARKAGAAPVLVTPPVLRTNDPVSGKIFTNMPPPADAGPYADAIRAVGASEGAPVLDLREEMRKTYAETGDRANGFLHPPADITKEPASNVRGHKQWISPRPRNPLYFSGTGADSLAHWIANLLRAGDAPLKKLLRPVDGPPAADYKLAWSDEFDGVTWTNNWRMHGQGKRKDGWNSPDCVRIDGEGNLVIDIVQRTNGVHAGLVSTERIRDWKYGYFECRGTIADGDGYWSAFWLMSDRVGDPQWKGAKVDDTANNGTEIDIYECMKSQGDVVHHNLHWNGYGEAHKSSPFDSFVPGLRKDRWHVFGLDWRPDGYTFYVDGRRAWETTDAISHTPEYIILSVEIGKWAGDIAKADLPRQVLFDWVRVWQRPEK